LHQSEEFTNKTLSNLTVTESMFILDPDKYQGRLMMKYSILELLFKKALQIEIREEKKVKFLRKTAETVEQNYIFANQSYLQENKLKKHQSLFFLTGQFMTNGLQLRDYMLKLKEEVSGPHVTDLVREDLITQRLVHKEKRKFLFIIPYERYALNEKGLKAQEKLQKLLEEGRKNIATWVETDPVKAKAFILICGSKMLLLDIELKQLQEWMQILDGLNFARHSADDSSLLWHDHTTMNSFEGDFEGLALDFPDFDFDFDFDFPNLDFDFPDLDFDFDFPDLDFDFDFDFDNDVDD